MCSTKTRKGMFLILTITALLATAGTVFADLPQIDQAKSFKTHGTTEYPVNLLDTANNEDVESRVGGVTDLRVKFDINIQCVDGCSTDDVTITCGTIDSVTVDGLWLYVGISDVTDRTCVTVEFPGIADASDSNDICEDELPVRQLVADAETDGYVTEDDRELVRINVGYPVTSSNFRCDINHDGSINAGDRLYARDAEGNLVCDTECP